MPCFLKFERLTTQKSPKFGLQNFECSTSEWYISQSFQRISTILSSESKLGYTFFRTEKLFNTYSMEQPDLYYFETIKMTSRAWPNFVWRIRAAGEYSL